MEINADQSALMLIISLTAQFRIDAVFQNTENFQSTVCCKTNFDQNATRKNSKELGTSVLVQMYLLL
jgi:hypothetical protein